MTGYEYGAGGGGYTKEGWLELVLHGEVHPKAPLSWIKVQADQEGRKPPAVYAIWAKYPPERKWRAWPMADEEDSRRAG
jgi:hypothetical protein